MPKIRGNTQILDGSVHGAQLEDSGVTAGTYGDDLNVAQITVDAKGRVTDITEVAITGGGGGSGSIVAASAYRGTNQTLTHATEAAISMSATNFDTNTLWSGSNPTRLTIGSDGKYQVNAQIALGTNFAGVGHLRIYVNGSQVAGNSFAGNDVSSGTERHTVTWIGDLVAGDYIELKVQLDLAVGSGTFDVVGGSTSTFLQTIGGVTGTVTAGGGGSIVFLEEHLASSSAELDFTAWYSTDYDDYIIELINVLPATDGQDLYVQCSTDGGSTYDAGSHYRWSGFAYNHANFSTTTGSGNSSTNDTKGFIGGGVTNDATPGGLCGTIQIKNPGSTSYEKNFYGDVVFKANDTNRYRESVNVFYMITSAVNALRFFFGSGNIASGTIRIYGRKHV